MKEGNFTLQEIYEGLKAYRGAIGTLAAEAKCTRQWINLVLTGKWTDPDLVKKAAEVWVRYAENANKHNDSISQLVNRARSLQSTVLA